MEGLPEADSLMPCIQVHQYLKQGTGFFFVVEVFLFFFNTRTSFSLKFVPMEGPFTDGEKKRTPTGLMPR